MTISIFRAALRKMEMVLLKMMMMMRLMRIIMMINYHDENVEECVKSFVIEFCTVLVVL